MFWYVARCKAGKTKKLVSTLNKQANMNAFIPKSERWFGRQGKTIEFIVKELYPDYVFIKSSLDMESFDKRFKEYFKTISGLIDLLEYKDTYPLTSNEQVLLEKLLDNADTIKHTKGIVVDQKFVPTDGPLVGLEDMIKKVDKHRRIATLDTSILTGKLMVAIEIEY
ncbi:transcription termination/antitermination NusG family protein [Candidatus Stoquefichus sp. SB1]|uniref:transcription termination/antitermination NusG family protein n=1 Tax=Candidatus Stoquefichus sp. SB1 TaxID=1658109 RepID=UPI00067E969A|nr:transcription termination/antitermination NusG family protein [Candidatus Stoquefichus sp. SB1]